MKNIDLPRIVSDRLLSLGAEPGDRCLVAFSGGQDSTALLLAMLSGWGGRGLTAAAHLDHAVRQGSEREQEKVRELCLQLDVELRTGHLDPGEVLRTAKLAGSLEAAMRSFRYGFLRSAARSLGAKWVLTGHTADDQVETVLFRVVRRMDPMSFSGIPDRRSCIIRPLLGVGREATYRYCMEKGIVPLLDPSNHDCRFARNRIRYHTIPALKSTFHPELDEHVLRLSSLVKGMERAEKAVLQEAGFQVIEDGNGSYYLLQSHVFPGVLTDSAIGRYLHMVTGRRPSRSLLREAVEHLHGRKRGRMSLPGGKVMDSDGERTYIYNRDQDEQLFMPEDAVRLTVPGRVRFERAGVIITAEYGALKELKRFPAGDTVLIGRKGLKEPLWVRRRHPGDRFVPLGTDGSKKLKDFFIDRKIPRRKRDAVPLVLDSGGEILWVAGVEISRKAALKGFEGEEAVVLRMEKSGHRTQGSGLSNNRIQNPEDCSQEED